MRAAVRSLVCLDIDPATWRPASSAWAVAVRFVAGPADGPGEESFDLTACQADWLADRAEREGVVDARHHLVVTGFAWPAISAQVDRRVRQLEAPDWTQLATRLGWLGYWEFED